MRIDRFFRRKDTWLAQALTSLSSRRGTAYTRSAAKRALDLAVTVPLALLVILVVSILLVLNKVLYPRHSALFLQDRVGRRGRALRVVKIRSLIRGRGPDGTHGASVACTAFGRLLRRHYLDELPQLLQVVAGQLSVVGIRVLPREVYDGLRDSWSRERFEAWQAMYATAPLGLSGVHQVYRRGGKEDRRRFHRDMFYARHASLSFDLYLLWRTLGTVDSEPIRAAWRPPRTEGGILAASSTQRGGVPVAGRVVPQGVDW